MQKYKTNWDLSLLYKNENDPEIEKYLKKYESAYGKLEKRYKGKDFWKLLSTERSYSPILMAMSHTGTLL